MRRPPGVKISSVERIPLSARSETGSEGAPTSSSGSPKLSTGSSWLSSSSILSILRFNQRCNRLRNGVASGRSHQRNHQPPSTATSTCIALTTFTRISARIRPIHRCSRSKRKTPPCAKAARSSGASVGVGRSFDCSRYSRKTRAGSHGVESSTMSSRLMARNGPTPAPLASP